MKPYHCNTNANTSINKSYIEPDKKKGLKSHQNTKDFTKINLVEKQKPRKKILNCSIDVDVYDKRQQDATNNN